MYAIIIWNGGRKCLNIYYSKFAKDQLFDIAYFSPIDNDTPVREPHYCVLKLSTCHVWLALIIFNSFKSIVIFITNTQKKHTVEKVILSKFWVVYMHILIPGLLEVSLWPSKGV